MKCASSPFPTLGEGGGLDGERLVSHCEYGSKEVFWTAVNPEMVGTSKKY